jgi:hypothetical protein
MDHADFVHAISRAPAPALPQMGGCGGFYDLDVVCEVAKERRLELVLM